MVGFAPFPLCANTLQEGKPGPGEPAPFFTVEDLEGKKACLEEIIRSDKVVLLNFWGLRCGACIEEIGYLNPMYEKYRDQGVVFLGVNVDGIGADIIKKMMPKMPNVPRYTVIPDPGFTIPDLYNMMAAPLSFVIGRDGKILYRHEDFKPGDEKGLEEALQNAIAMTK
jgi:peroxiredoxin